MNEQDDVVTITDTSQPASANDVVVNDPDVAVIKADAADAKQLPERAIEHEDGSIELPLFVPVVLRWKSTDSGEVKEDPPIHSVTFRRITGKDVRVIMNAGTGDSFHDELTAACVRMQFPNKHKWRSIMDRMDGADTAACIRIAQHFLESGPRTPGPKSSRN